MRKRHEAWLKKHPPGGFHFTPITTCIPTGTMFYDHNQFLRDSGNRKVEVSIEKGIELCQIQETGHSPCHAYWVVVKEANGRLRHLPCQQPPEQPEFVARDYSHHCTLEPQGESAARLGVRRSSRAQRNAAPRAPRPRRPPRRRLPELPRRRRRRQHFAQVPREVRAPTISHEKSIPARRCETRAMQRTILHCRYRLETVKGLTDAIAYREALRKRIAAAKTREAVNTAIKFLEGTGIAAALMFI